MVIACFLSQQALLRLSMTGNRRGRDGERLREGGQGGCSKAKALHWALLAVSAERGLGCM